MFFVYYADSWIGYAGGADDVGIYECGCGAVGGYAPVGDWPKCKSVRSEVGFVLYLGIYGLALAVTCEIAILKMMYDMAGVESIGYGLSSAAVMLLLLLVFYACHFRALQQGTYQSMERKGGV